MLVVEPQCRTFKSMRDSSPRNDVRQDISQSERNKRNCNCGGCGRWDDGRGEKGQEEETGRTQHPRCIPPSFPLITLRQHPAKILDILAGPIVSQVLRGRRLGLTKWLTSLFLSKC